MAGSGAPSSDQGSVMAGESRDNALDHVIVVVFENRSLDNVLGRLHDFLAIQFPPLHPAAPSPATAT